MSSEPTVPQPANGNDATESCSEHMLQQLIQEQDAARNTQRLRAYAFKARNRKLSFRQDPVEKISSALFEILCNYHQNLLLPLLWLMLITIGFAEIYFSQGVFCVTHQNIALDNYWMLDICHAKIKRVGVFAMSQTFWPVAAFTQGDIWDIQSKWVKLASYIHILMVTLVWFLLVSGIRKRFKL